MNFLTGLARRFLKFKRGAAEEESKEKKSKSEPEGVKAEPEKAELKAALTGLRFKIVLGATALLIAAISGWASWKMFFSEEAAGPVPVEERRAANHWVPLSVTDTALFNAVRRGDAEEVSICLQAGANSHAVNEGGITPLKAAIAMGRGDIVREFVKASQGGDLDNWAAALVYAVVQNRPQMITEIAALPLDLDAPDKNGLTPLLYAVERNLTGAAKELLNAGADPNATDRAGLPPLIAAVNRGKHDMVAALLNAGADWKVPSPSGETAAGIARQNRREVILALLTEAENPSAPPEDRYKEYMKLPQDSQITQELQGTQGA